MSQRRTAPVVPPHPGLAPWLDTLVCGDCLEVLPQLPEESVDLIFADPPYNLQLAQPLHRPDESAVDAVTEHWDQFSSFAEYDAFTRAWLTACRRVLKPSGTIWVIGSYHNIYRVGALMQDLGFWFLNDVIWIKRNPMPNFRGVRLTDAHETLLWCKRSADATGYTFNYHELKGANGGKQMRSDWYFTLCSGPERLRDADGQKIHPTQKPLGLLRRILAATTQPGQVVLDPFVGVGTTAVAAVERGCHYVGIDREEPYIAAGRERLTSIQLALPQPMTNDD